MTRPIREVMERMQPTLSAVQKLADEHRRMIAPALELQQRLRLFDPLEISGISEAMRRAQEAMAPIQEATAHFRAASEAARRLGAFPEAATLLSSNAWENMATIRAMTAGLADLVPPAIHADMVAASAMAASQAEWLPEARQRSFLVDAIAVVDEAAATDSWDDLPERLEASLVDHLETAQSDFEAAWLLALYRWLTNNLLVIVGLVIACAGLAQNHLSSETSDAQHAERMKALERIEQAVSAKAPEVEESRRFIDIHVPCVMTRDRDPSSQSSADILPGERLEVLEEVDGRMKVALYDRIKGRTLVGWIDSNLISE